MTDSQGTSQTPLETGAASSSNAKLQARQARQFKRTVTRGLRELAAKEDIKCTASLVAAYNASEDREQRLFYREWFDRCHDWFANQKSECLSEDGVHSYSHLAEIKPQCREDEKIVKSLFSTLCNRVREGDYDDNKFISAVDYTLNVADESVFKKGVSQFIRLINELLVKLDPTTTAFTRETYETHSVVLSAVYQAMSVLRRVAPRQFDMQKQRGVYKSFHDKLDAIAEYEEYYPFLYQAELIKQSLVRLASSDNCARLMSVGRRFLKGVWGGLYLVKAARAAIELEIEPDAVEAGCKKLKEAFADDRVSEKDWYDWLRYLEEASLWTSCARDNEVFESCFHRVMEIQQGMPKGEDRRALRFGIVQQLCLLAVNGETPEIRELAAEELFALGFGGTPGDLWHDDSAIFEGLLNALHAIYLEGEQGDDAEAVLQTMADVEEDFLQKAFKEWLGGESLETKLSKEPHEDAHDDILFHKVRKDIGLMQTANDVAESIAKLKETYTRDRFAKIASLFEERTKTHVNKFKHDLVLYEQVAKEDLLTLAELQNKFSENPDQAIDYLTRKRRVRKTISLESIFDAKNPNEPVKTVLLFGNPGTGKTSISKRIAYEWAIGNEKMDFKVVFHLQMRELNGTNYNNYSDRTQKTIAAAIANICFPFEGKDDLYTALRSQIADDLDKRSTLLILDGLDEAAATGQEMLDMAKEKNCKLLLLSRPYNLSEERELADNEIECLGLSDAQLADFVLSELSAEAADRLLQYLRANPAIWDVAHVPVTANILCFLWREREARLVRKNVSASMLLLYSEMVLFVWDRYVQKCDSEVSKREDVFKALEKIAFNALKDGQILISPTLVRRYSPGGTSRNILRDAGFLLLRMEGAVYQFPHLTFQEYFAGQFLAKGLCDGSNRDRNEAVGFLSQHKYDTKYRVTFSFAMQEVCSLQAIRGFNELMSIFDKEPYDIIGVHHMFLLLNVVEAYLSVSERAYHQDVVRNPITERLAESAAAVPLGFRHQDRLMEPLLSNLEQLPNVLQSCRGLLQAWMKEFFENYPRGSFPGFVHIVRLAKYAQDPMQTSVELITHKGCKSEIGMTRMEATAQMAQIGKTNPSYAQTSFAALEEAIEDSYSLVRCSAVEQMTKLAKDVPELIPQTFQRLLTTCRDNNWSTRRMAVTSMKEILNTASGHLQIGVEILAGLCHDLHRGVRIEAFSLIPFELENSTDPAREKLKLLSDGCADPDVEVRLAATDQMSAFIAAHPREAEAALDLLSRAGKNENDSVRLKVLEQVVAASQVRPDCADGILPLLKQASEDREEWIREMVMDHLVTLYERFPDHAEAVIDILSNGCEDASLYVREKATSCRETVQQSSSARAQAKLKSVKEECEDGDVWSHMEAIRDVAVVAKQDPQLVDHVLDIVKKGCEEPMAWIRVESIRQTTELLKASPEKEDAVLDVLLHGLRDEHEKVRAAARTALGRLSFEQQIRFFWSSKEKLVAASLAERLCDVAATVSDCEDPDSLKLKIHMISEPIEFEKPQADVRYFVSCIHEHLVATCRGLFDVPELQRIRELKRTLRTSEQE